MIQELIAMATRFREIYQDFSPTSIGLISIYGCRKQPEVQLNNNGFDRTFADADYTISRVINDEGEVYYEKSIEIDGCRIFAHTENRQLTLKDRTMLGLPGEEF